MATKMPPYEAEAVKKYKHKLWKGRDYIIDERTGKAYTLKGAHHIPPCDVIFAGYHPNKHMAELWWQYIADVYWEGSNQYRTMNDEIDYRTGWFRHEYYGE